MTAKKVYILGIGFKPLEDRAGAILREADVVLSSPRLLEVFRRYPEYSGVEGKTVVIGKVGDTLDYIEANRERQSIVLLGSGDPMFHGIGRQVIARCGAEHVEVMPDLSSVQVAFSRIGVRWDDAFLMSLHGGLVPGKGMRAHSLADLPALIAMHRKIAVLTDEKNNPTAIARVFLSRPDSHGIRIFVCEKLGYQDEERITSGTPEEIGQKEFSDLNVVILLTEASADAAPDRGSETVDTGLRTGPPFGLSEEEISHSRGLITKDEVRAVSLHRLRLPAEGVLWDIGAGSGSLSIEAAGLSARLRIFAIEKRDEEIGHLEENKARFCVPNLQIVRGEAPDALLALPDPVRVFVGGGGGSMAAILEKVSERMAGGIVVVNAVTLESLGEAVKTLEGEGFDVDVAQVSVSKSKELAGRKYLAALNPVFIVKGERI